MYGATPPEKIHSNPSSSDVLRREIFHQRPTECPRFHTLRVRYVAWQDTAELFSGQWRLQIEGWESLKN